MKKGKSFSHIEAQDALELLNESKPTGEELVYSLLRIFCGYGDGQIRRIREGIGNKIKDGRTVLVPKVIAYRPKGCLDFHEEIKQMQAEPKIAKHSPRLYVVSDGQAIVALDPIEQDIYENKVALMWKDFDFFYPLAGIEKFRNMEEAEADVKSAELMAKIYDEIRRHNDIKDKTEMHNLNVFMSRLLFCFFAEDTNLFPESNLFTNSIRKYTADDGHDLAEFIERAFLAMSVEERDSLEIPNIYSVFPYVNGGLFKQHVPIPTLSRRARVLILKCGDYDWKEINPDIFGSMIQAVVTPEMRAGLGMHYTSVPNIMKLIQPLFLDELHEAYRKAVEERSVKKLQELLSRMSKIKFFDPACGSGNFLIISYKRIRELEIQIWQAIADISRHPVLPFSQIALTQFYGIEIDEYACDTAKLSLWLAEHQMNNKFNETFGTRPQALPLRASGNIVCGNACRVDWNSVCPHTADEEVYIMGNPPYLGSRSQTIEHKEDSHFSMASIKHYRKLDYIANWFINGTRYINLCNAQLAFVTTNSICQGEQVKILWPSILTDNIEIGFAYETFKWTNNAKDNAAVTVNIIGLVNKPYAHKYLYSETAKIKVDTISPLLTSKDEILVEKSTVAITPFFPEMRRGNMPNDKEHLRITPEQKNVIISQYPNSKKFIRLQVGADELINDIEKYCFWIPDEDFNEAYSIPPIADAIDKVRDYRINSKDKTLHIQANKPHQFREFFECSANSLVIPIVSSERREIVPIAFVPDKTIVPNSAQVIYEANLIMFAILTSKMHNLWIRKNAGRLKTDYRYSITLCYNTFPFPEIGEVQKEELEKLAQRVIDVREENYDLTLAKLYNPESMPNDLREAHHRLDFAVERCYRSEPFISDEERLEYLFKLYVKMTKKN